LQDPTHLQPEHLVDRIHAGGWPVFYSSYLEISSYFCAANDFAFAVMDYAARLASQNVLYAEVYCTPTLHVRRGLDLHDLGLALIEGITAAERECGVRVRLIYDLVRTPDEDGRQILAALRELPSHLFPALGISGGPSDIPLSEYEQLCADAARSGRAITVHAGELEGPQSVRRALRYAKPARIGHGVRAIEDFSLLIELAMRNVHLEICPTSNRVLNVCEDPLDAASLLYHSGINCSIAADDDLLFNTTLNHEIEQMVQHTDLTLQDIGAMQIAAVRAAFTDDDTKASLYSAVHADWVLPTRR
jgi:adenosine deaminase